MRARLAMLESLYRFDVDEATHVQLISEAAAQHWRTRGAIVLVTARMVESGRTEMTPLGIARDGGREYRPIIADLLQDMSEDEFRACLTVLPAYGGVRESEVSGVLKARISVRMAHRWQIRDMLGCYCSTYEGGLVGLMNSLDDVVATSHRERAFWQPVAAHLAAAWRLRQRLALGVTATDLADAVLLPDGRCIAEPHTALDGPVRDRLRDLVRHREHERSARATTDGLWSELADGRWTFIDHHEATGRRVVLAVRNSPMGASLCRLTRREIDALVMARGGASNKAIGLDMNTTASAVTRLLQSAARKLNAAVADLVQFLAPDTLRCRTLLVGETELMALSHDTIDHWQSMLSGAERSVVAELLRGRSNREIAALRGRSVRTVVNQLASAFEKLGVRSRRELMCRCAGRDAADPAPA